MAELETCKGCGKMLGDIYPIFRERVEAMVKTKIGNKPKIGLSEDMYVNALFSPSLITDEGCGKILDELHITKECCRIHIMQHVSFGELYRGVRQI